MKAPDVKRLCWITVARCDLGNGEWRGGKLVGKSKRGVVSKWEMLSETCFYFPKYNM